MTDEPKASRFPAPPFIVVIFNARRTPADPEGYAAMAAAMEALLEEAEGYIAHDFLRAEDGSTSTISYWTSLDAVAAFRRQEDHRRAQGLGRTVWYDWYERLTAEVKSLHVHGERGAPC